MLPAMATKPRIAIVGPGNLGTALALSLRKAGYTIDAVISTASSLNKARVLVKQTGARVLSSSADIKADLVWFCVPDSEIARAARKLATIPWKGRVALHSSGALTSDELDVLRKKGAAVASAHPLMTFVE